MYYTRMLESSIEEASAQFPVLLVTGPRQVGKTTLLRHLCGETRSYVTLDDLSLRSLANDDPALFLQRFPPPVLIDEIQYAPDLLPYIKMHVDEEGKPGAFWLTGSQQFRMMKGVTESLAGRVAILNLLGFSSREADKRETDIEPFLPTKECLDKREPSEGKTSVNSLFERIWRGGYPALTAGPVTDRDLFYSSYLQTYLQRDVQDLAQVGNAETFLRFLRACAARTGQLLNYAELARDVDVSLKTAQHWLSILTASYQVFLLQPYHTNITKRIVKTPKLYMLDTGLASYLTEWSSPETLAAGAMNGAMLETWALSELLKSYWHRRQTPGLYFYRDRDGREIDFLLIRDRTVYPLEVKLAATAKKSWVRHFHVLDKLDLTVGEGGVLCLSERRIPLTGSCDTIPMGLI